jgi:hypothetical protein
LGFFSFLRLLSEFSVLIPYVALTNLDNLQPLPVGDYYGLNPLSQNGEMLHGEEDWRLRFFRAHQDQLARKGPSPSVSEKSERSDGSGLDNARKQPRGDVDEDNDWNTKFVPEVLSP